MRARIRWDNLNTEWSEDIVVPDEHNHILLKIPPPVDWQFNVDMVTALDGRVAVQATYIIVEIEKEVRPLL